MVVITASDAILLSDQSWCSEKMKAWSPIPSRADPRLARTLTEVLQSSNVRKGKIGVAGWNIFPTPIYLGVKKDLPGLEFEETNILMELRAIKGPNEIALMKEACRITDLAFEEAMKTAQEGKTEYDIIAAGEYVIRSSGAELSWQHEVGSGAKRNALLGPLPTTKKVENGEIVMVDMGASYKGYHADITRLKPVGKVTKDQRDAFAVELQAVDEAVAATRPGANGSDVYKAACKPILESKYSKYEGWGAAGHGNGLDQHEWPFIDSETDFRLAPGMIFCLEPFLAPPQLGLIRLEDMVLVTETGKEVLTKFPRELW